jgi:myosin-crossreactive antigen
LLVKKKFLKKARELISLVSKELNIGRLTSKKFIQHSLFEKNIIVHICEKNAFKDGHLFFQIQHLMIQLITEIVLKEGFMALNDLNMEVYCVLYSNGNFIIFNRKVC